MSFGDNLERQKDFEQLQKLLLEAIFDRSALQLALKKFAAICGAPISQLMVAQRNRTLLTSIFSEELEADIAPTEALYQDINPRVLATPYMPQGKSTRDKDFISYDKIHADQTYQELILPAGLGHFSGVPVIHNDLMTAGIALHRPLSDDPFNDDEAFLHEVASRVCEPVLAFAAQIEAQHVRSTLDLIGRSKAVAVLDYAGRVTDQNESFDALVVQNLLRIEQDKTLKLASKEAQTSLLRALGSHTGIIGGSFALKDEVGRSVWMCQVVPKPAFTLAGPEAGHALLICDRVDQPLQLDVALLRDVFGLTKVEGEIASLLYLGRSVRDIAAVRSVSLETVRSHIKSLLNKTETGRQAELVAKIARFAKHSIA